MTGCCLIIPSYLPGGAKNGRITPGFDTRISGLLYCLRDPQLICVTLIGRLVKDRRTDAGLWRISL